MGNVRLTRAVVRCLTGLGLCLAIAGPAWSAPYSADKIVPLPAPNPDYTNTDSGTIILGADPRTVIVMVENELRYDHWKEWRIVYTITPLNPNNWLADLHIDYSLLVNPGAELPLFDNLTSDLATALWQTYYATQTSDIPYVWTAVGCPAGTSPLKVDPQTADLVVDTWPFYWNPPWVSIEFSGSNVQIDYTFIDWCIPEPSALGVLALAGLGVLRRRR